MHRNDNSQQKQVKWQVTMHLGWIRSLAPLLGKAIAQNNITIMNGHVRTDDGVNRLYSPALDMFTREAMKTPLDYRVLVLNGCKTKSLEDMVQSSPAR